MDGVLFVGKDSPKLVGGVKLINMIRTEGKKLSLLTNNTTNTREEIWRKLSSLGLEFHLDEILTSSYLTAKYINDKFSTTNCFLLGEDGFRKELTSFGHRVVDDDADVVVVGLDRNLTYDKLDKAVKLVRAGAGMIASHTSRFYMDDGGARIGPGAIVKGLEYASQTRAVVIGKPESTMFNMALSLNDCEPKNAVMIGDQFETDMTGAKKLGIYTALVLTGVEDMKSVEKSSLIPDVILENIDDILRYL